MLSNKRKREEEDEGLAIQRKTFINQRIVDESDQYKMAEVHQKTIQLLFQGARMMDKHLPLLPIRLFGNGQIEILRGFESRFSLPAKPESACDQCRNWARIRSFCSNCWPTELCEFCGISCNFCDALMCARCVQSGGCNLINGSPCCDRCKDFN